MKTILLASKSEGLVTKHIRISADAQPKEYEFDFKDGIPVEVPQKFAEALLKTYPENYSKSKLTKEEVTELVEASEQKEEEELKARLKAEKKAEKAKKEVVDPFKTGIPKKNIPEKIGQQFPIEKTDFTEEELLKHMNGELVEILQKNNGQEKLPVNTKKVDLVGLILEAQKG